MFSKRVNRWQESTLRRTPWTPTPVTGPTPRTLPFTKWRRSSPTRSRSPLLESQWSIGSAHPRSCNGSDDEWNNRCHRLCALQQGRDAHGRPRSRRRTALHGRTAWGDQVHLGTQHAIFQMAAAALPRKVFACVLSLINGLRGPPARWLQYDRTHPQTLLSSLRGLDRCARRSAQIGPTLLDRVSFAPHAFGTAPNAAHRPPFGLVHAAAKIYR